MVWIGTKKKKYKISNYHIKIIIGSCLICGITTAGVTLVTRCNLPSNLYEIIAIETFFTPYLCMAARAESKGKKLVDKWFIGMDNLRNVYLDFQLDADLENILSGKDKKYIQEFAYKSIKENVLNC